MGPPGSSPSNPKEFEMLSDAISDAEARMRSYLNNPIYNYEWLQPRINNLLREMARVRSMLDIRGNSITGCWLHVRPIYQLLREEPLDHEQIDKLIDTLLDQGPPTEEQENEWLKQMREADSQPNQ
jgi:hypothetical protein